MRFSAKSGSKALSSLAPGRQAVVVEIEGNEEESRRLGELGVSAGSSLIVVARLPFGGPIVAQFEGWKLAIGRRLAQRIRVSESRYKTNS
ncbi:MAG TPA: ferrous iron transport protein A [Firmicutes bacterium]|nr:ferrous iron transport protein A [Bacillota bacterium]